MKLGYTFYLKDWNTSEKVFQLDLAERGLYRELIDLAFLNDNKTKINIAVWSRKFNADANEIESILDVLQVLELIQIEDSIIFIPSCEARLNMIRGGKKGGQKSRKNKPISKPIPKQKKVKETKNKKEIIPSLDEFLKYADEQTDNCDLLKVNLKYKSWVENKWHDGNDKPIKNWKQKLLNTLPYLMKKEDTQDKLNKAPKPLNK